MEVIHSGDSHVQAARFLVSILIPMILLSEACGDRAEVQYDACVKAEAANDLAGAVAACTAAVNITVDSPKGKLAAAKLYDLRPKYAVYKVQHMTVLTEEFCDGLVEHLTTKIADLLDRKQQEDPPSLRQPYEALEALARDAAQTKATACKDDIFYKKDLGYWKCQWLSDAKDLDNCKEDDRK